MQVLATLAPVLVFVGAFVLYLSTLAPGMLRGDSGEFQWAMASLNVAHATGYPLFTLLGYLWQLLPLSNNLAWQLNLLAPLFSALAVATLFVLIRAVTARADAALIGALLFACAPVIWFNSSILEVYALHTFLLALWLYLLYRWSRHPAHDAPLYLSFFVLGLGLAHHRLMLLTLPALFYFLFATDRKFFFNLPRLLLCALLVVPGLLLYLYVPLRLLPEGFSFEFAFYDVILGREYATSLLRELHPLPVLVEIPVRNFHIGLLLALVGALALFRRAKHFNTALWLVYLADVAFALVYSVPDIEVFLTSSFVVIAIWAGGGAAFLIDWTGTRVRVQYARRAQIALAIVLSLLALVGVARFAEIRTAVAAEAAPEARARAIAADNSPGGAMLELDWETATALRFLQASENLRPDLEARLIALDRREEFWRALYNVNAGRAVLIERGVKWTRAPAGFALEPRANDLAQIVRVPIEMTAASARVTDSIELAGYASTPQAFTVFWRVKKPLNKDVSTFVHYLNANGEKIGQDDRGACCEAVYSFRTSEWEAGQLYADVFKPAPEDAVTFLVGMYETVNAEIEPYGETIPITR